MDKGLSHNLGFCFSWRRNLVAALGLVVFLFIGVGSGWAECDCSKGLGKAEQNGNKNGNKTSQAPKPAEPKPIDQKCLDECAAREAKRAGGKPPDVPTRAQDKISTSPPPVPSPAAATVPGKPPYDSTTDLNGIEGARGTASQARGFSRGNEALASYERGAQSSLTSDHSRVSSYANPLFSNPDPQAQSRLQEYLQQSASPPAEYEHLYKELGLHTNRDILEKAPEYAKNLSEAAPERERLAKEWDNQAKLADKAASKMEEFTKTLEQRNTNIASVDKENLLSQKAKESTDSTAYPARVAAANAGLPSLDGSKLTATTDPASATGENSNKLKGEKLSAGSGGNGNGSSGEMAGAGSGRGPASLNSSLREALLKGKGKKAGDAEGEEKAEAPKSAFDSIFEKTESEKLAADAAEAKAARDRLARGGAFSMNGSETDAAVKKFLNGVDGQGSSEDKAVFGSIDQSIFARMTSYLTRAQAEKKITVRQ